MSITTSKPYLECFTVRFFLKGLGGLLLLLVLGSCGSALRAQTVRIELLDGRNGRPMADKCVGVSVDTFNRTLGVRTDSQGVVRLRLTKNDNEINTQNQPNGCGDWPVVKPVVKYSHSVSIVAGYVLCEARKPDHSWLAKLTFSVKKVLEYGVVTANTCGKAKASPKPGEIILFVRPLNFWEKLKE